MIETIWVAILKPTTLVSIVLPGFFLFGASAFRWLLKLPFSSGADTLLAIIAFDCTAIVSGKEFRVLFASANLAHNLIQIHLLLALVSVFCWGGLILKAEPALLAQAKRDSLRSGKSFLAASFGVIAAALAITLHVITYRAGAGTT